MEIDHHWQSHQDTVRYAKDSKIIQLISGKTEDRIAIYISSPIQIGNQFIAWPEFPSRKGESISNAALDCLHKMKMDTQVEAIATVNKNGQLKGIITLFE